MPSGARTILITAMLLLLLARGRSGGEAAAAALPWAGHMPEPLWLAAGGLAGIALTVAACLYLRGLALLPVRIPRRRDIPRHPIVLALVAIIVGPLVEEALVRGFIMGGLLLPAWGPLGALALSALLFGLAHPLPSAAWATACGLALGALALASGSIWPAAVAHATVNAWAVARLLRERGPVSVATPALARTSAFRREEGA